MRTNGSVPPTLMALTPEGFMMMVPSHLSNEAGKVKASLRGEYKRDACATLPTSGTLAATLPPKHRRGRAHLRKLHVCQAKGFPVRSSAFRRQGSCPAAFEDPPWTLRCKALQMVPT